MSKQDDMTYTRAISILECIAMDMVGALAGLSETNPLADVLSQRIDAINLSQDALRKASVESLIEQDIEVDVYCGRYSDTVVRRKAKIVGDMVLQIECLECGGTGWWDFGPDEEIPGPCVQCKGTGKQYLGI